MQDADMIHSFALIRRLLLALFVLGMVAGCAPVVTEERMEEPPPAVVEEEPEELPEVPEPTPPAVEEEPLEEEPGRLELRLNAGGQEVTVAGATWLTDQHFIGGQSTSNERVTEIAGTEDDEIYLSARVSQADLEGFSYSIPVPVEGLYEVRLHFSELYWGAPGPGSDGGEGSRVFSVSFEDGAVTFSDYDIYAEVGAATASVKAFEVPVADGVLDIVFTATVNRPKVSAIEVLGPLE